MLTTSGSMNLYSQELYVKVKMWVTQSRLTHCDPMNCSPTRPLCPWNSLDKKTGMGCHFLLQGIFPTQGSNLGLPHCRQTPKWATREAYIQFSSVAQSCLTLCDPMNSSMPGLPVHHQLPEFTQIHVPGVGDAIQPSHSLSSPSPPAPNPSQHQGLTQWINSLHEVAKVLEFQL